MPLSPVQQVVHKLRSQATLAPLSDGELLGAFVRERSESAFAELVRRHGSMVWGVCCRILANRQDAEDCYQATFLVLVRKANTVRPGSRVGAWLHGVAYHAALKARHVAARRASKEQQIERLPEPILVSDSADVRGLLDSGLSELPEKYRVPIVLCELEGRSIKEVAQELGAPVGTVAGWLSRGRGLLARRLMKHGIPAAALTTILAESAQSAPPAVADTVATVAASNLADAVVRGLFLAKLKSSLMGTAAVILIAAMGFGIWVRQAGSDPVQSAVPPPEPASKKVLADDPIAPKKVPAHDPFAWGEAVDGVEYGVAFKDDRKSYHLGESVTFVFKARNVSAKPVQFEQLAISTSVSTTKADQVGVILPKVHDAKGKEIKVHPMTPDGDLPLAFFRTIRLAPKESATLGEASYTLGAGVQLPRIDLTPGTYKVQFPTTSYVAQRPTGVLEMTVLEAKIKRKPGLVELFSKLEIGMARDKVETLLGKPIFKDLKQPDGVEVNYLGDEFRERVLEMQESPFLPAGIYLTYVDGKLTKKSFNPQWLRKIAWGKAVNGVEYGLALQHNARQYRVGEKVTLILHARNTTGRPVRFEQIEITGLGSSFGKTLGSSLPTVIDANGKTVKVTPQYLAGLPHQAKKINIDLKEKGTAALGEVTFTIGRADNNPQIDAEPGLYFLHFDTVCWIPGHQRPTGVMEILVLPKEK